MALALIPEELVPTLFSSLVEDLHLFEPEQLHGILKYFDDNWMCKISLWNVYKILDRTNNCCERYMKSVISIILWFSFIFL